MRNIKAASRYASALLELSKEKNNLDKIYEDIVSLQKTVEGSKELQNLLNSPIVKADKKAEALKAIFSQEFDQLTIQYLELLASKSREALIPEIANQFVNQYNNHYNIVEVEVTSAVKLDDAQRNKVLSLVKHDGKVNIKESIDPSIIGGFVVKIGDKQIDASVAKQFKELRKEIILN